MLDKKQEQMVQNMLESLTNLQIKTKIIESQRMKGLTQTDEQEDLQVAMESIRLSAIELAELLAQMFDSKGMDFLADKLQKQTNEPAKFAENIQELDQVIAELLKEAEKRLKRNTQRRERLEIAEKQAEESNEKERLKQVELTSKARPSAEQQTASKDMPSESRSRTSAKSLLGSTRARYSPYPARLFDVPRKVKPKKRKSNLIHVKSSEARAKDFANQRALKKSEMAMTKSAPAMAPAQMSR